MHIGIAGNIGSGKTTLTTLLARHYGWTPKFESVTYNPYLADYYKDTRSVVIPGSYTKHFPAGDYSVSCALIIGQRKESTDKKTSLNAAL
ncbi:MAG: deoxynucleoside kinase, partial [Bacteroidales bacterium]|nr:deoxynucleoside kinase [Bacteroidales bacterium]